MFVWQHRNTLPFTVQIISSLYCLQVFHKMIYLLQVLSHTVSSVMSAYYGPEMSETSKFFMLVDRFFDCLNGRSLHEATRTRKSDLAAYTLPDDPRFEFLKTVFLGYLEEWKQAVMTRQGFSKQEKNKMFLSTQTHEGIVMTVNSFIDATKYLLQQGVPYLLSQVFCQDPLEEHFGRHRGLGARHDNPTIHQFSYQENQLRMQRSLAMNIVPKGNTAGRGDKRQTVISTSPLKRIKRN
ncbi:uncharacterized protein LOC134249818 [Saccostrea cucullata]|uniref:uncharacterized protein LOC134249818 n=1 Tax=Saccostrea cuccullata TaxID=36930 RepID=UPI002ED5700C